MPPALELRGVGKAFLRGDHAVVALEDVDLDVAPGEFVTILGPSGCGKSTLLHLVGGFDEPTLGEVRADGAVVTGPGRERGMVFQQATLFPWRTIEANVAWPIEVTGTGRRAARTRARELLELVGLADFGRSYPAELSGGMRQRAAIARTLAMEPRVLLMDEPFGALDAQTRELMQDELNRLWQESDLTVLFVTHDITEAVYLGDRVVVMSARPGRIIEDCPVTLARPRSAGVRSTIEFTAIRERLWGLIRAEITDVGESVSSE